MPTDRRTVARPRSPLNPTQSLAPRCRRPTKPRTTFEDAVTHRIPILAILAGSVPTERPKKAFWGKPKATDKAVKRADKLTRNFPDLFRTRTAKDLYIELSKRLDVDGTRTCWSMTEIQRWLGGVSRSTCQRALRNLTLDGALPLIRHEAGRPGRTGIYAFVTDPFKLRVEQERGKAPTIARREKCRQVRQRRRAAGSTAAACQRVGFKPDWMLPTTTITASRMDTLSLIYPAPATTTAMVPLGLPAHHLTASQLRDRCGGGWERYTPRNSHHLMTVTTWRAPPTPLAGAAQAEALSKDAALERIAGLKEALG
jgi:hypothetical protein